MAVFNIKALNQYLSLEYNVLMIGEHGVGKTAVIKELFKGAYGDRWRIFSGATLDPWVDFVGVPKVVEAQDGVRELALVRPSYIERDSVEAIFFDEFNRAQDKVINAVMELIQFKSINGHKLKNLKVIWVAINPDDDEGTYSVNKLDPAVKDRFHIHLKVPFEVDDNYFTKKYPATARQFIDWWRKLPEDSKRLCSPRRLEYVAHAFENSVRLEDLLPNQLNIKELRKLLESRPFQEQLKNIATADDAAKFLKHGNNATDLLDLVKAADTVATDFFTQHALSLPKELVEPFVSYLHAHKNGATMAKTFVELLELLPKSVKGDQYNTAAVINNADLAMIYRNGGSMTEDLKALKVSRPELINMTVNRVGDVLMTCKSDTFSKVIWHSSPTGDQVKTTFDRLTEELSKLGSFSQTHRNMINKRAAEWKIISSSNGAWL